MKSGTPAALLTLLSAFACLMTSQLSFAHIPLDSEEYPLADGLFAGVFSGFVRGSFNEVILIALVACYWILYLIGCSRHPPHRYQMLCFHAAFMLCVLALSGPLDQLAANNAAAHMSQHMLLMVVIAPLWVLSRPLPQICAGGGRFNLVLSHPMLSVTRYPLILAYFHGAVIWFWHMPYFYLLALENAWWHSLEHACFLLTAGLFWWSVLRSQHSNTAWALLAVLFTLMHTGFLGAVLTFASEPLYGERPLADQQLAGLIMWVVGAIPYMMAAIWIGYRWYQYALLRSCNPSENVLRQQVSQQARNT